MLVSPGWSRRVHLCYLATALSTEEDKETHLVINIRMIYEGTDGRITCWTTLPSGEAKDEWYGMVTKGQCER